MSNTERHLKSKSGTIVFSPLKAWELISNDYNPPKHPRYN